MSQKATSPLFGLHFFDLHGVDMFLGCSLLAKTARIIGQNTKAHLLTCFSPFVFGVSFFMAAQDGCLMAHGSWRVARDNATDGCGSPAFQFLTWLWVHHQVFAYDSYPAFKSLGLVSWLWVHHVCTDWC